MRQFGKGRNNIFRGVGISVVIFMGTLLLFLLAIGNATKQTQKEQKQSLADAVERSLLQCYVTEGCYPENFAYLEEKYGILYDKEQFRVDYQVYGTNMRPEVTILELEEAD